MPLRLRRAARIARPDRNLGRWWVACALLIATLAACGATSEVRSSPASTSEAESDSDLSILRARALFEEARVARNRGDHEGARSLAREAIDALISEQEGRDEDARADVLMKLAVFARNSGELGAAERAARRALEARSRTRPPEHRDVQSARIDLATTLYTRGEFETARALYEEVLEVFSRTLPSDHADLQVARMGLANTFYARGEFAAARSLYESVVEVDSRTLTPEHVDLQRARTNLANTLFAQGDLPGARALFEQVLDVRRRTLPPDDLELQQVRAGLAATLHVQGDLPAARVLKAQVMEVCSRTLPSDHPQLQQARVNLALTLFDQGDVSGARALYESAVEAYARTLLEDHPTLQAARLGLANTLVIQGELAAARALYEKVLSAYLRTRPPEDPDVQRARQNLGLALQAQGDLHGARALLEQALEGFARALPSEHPDVQAARVRLATNLLAQGDLAAARAMFEEVLEVYSRILPPDHPELQRVRVSLGSTLFYQGDLAAARALQEQALEGLSRTLEPDHPDLQRTRGTLANTLFVQGDLSAASAIQEQILESFSRTLPPGHPDQQRARGNLASILKARGDLDAARALMEEVIEVYSGVLPPEDPDLLRARANLAGILQDQGDFASARAIHEQVLAALTRASLAERPDLQVVRANFAINLASQVAADGGRADEHAWDLEKERYLELATTLTRIANQSAHTTLLSSSSREAEERFLSLQTDLSRSLSFASGCGVFGLDPDLNREAFILSETTRASALFSARLARLARSDDRYAALQRELRSAGEELARLVQSGATRDAYDAVIARRDRAQRDLVQLASESVDAASTFVEPDPAVLAARLSGGEAIVAYRRYTRTEIPVGGSKARLIESLCAFVICSSKELQRIELGPIEPIERAAADWRDALGTSMGRGLGVSEAAGDSSTALEHARRLGALVFDPLLESLRDSRRLVVLLDDPLQAVPIDALPLQDSASGAPMLGDRYVIEQRLTLQELLSESASKPDAGCVVVLGGADYSAEPEKHAGGIADTLAAAQIDPHASGIGAVPSVLRGGAWADGFGALPGTLQEARGVTKLAEGELGLGAIVLLESSVASRESIEELAPSARFLHLATHGWFAPESVKSWSDVDPPDESSAFAPRISAQDRVKGSSPMLLCGLALAGANLPADTLGRCRGLVTAEEISSWDLSKCELAVLSACDTNVGERRAGQGVASLQKALHMAGARAVITSLWKVPDEATKDLMLDFYRRIWIEKEPKTRALWEAKQRLRDAKDARGKPRYTTRDWAAWVLTGDPN